MMPQRTRRGRRGANTQVHRVTSAQEALSAEQSRRTRRYLVSMSIRTACFLAAIVVDGWLQWAFLAGAVVLPYVAVIAANAGRESDDFTAEPVASPVELAQRPTRIVLAEDAER
jgi:Protein of unknown function (DUF3099)